MTFSNKSECWRFHLPRMLVAVFIMPPLIFALREIIICVLSGTCGSLMDVLTGALKELCNHAAPTLIKALILGIHILACYCWYHGMRESQLWAEGDICKSNARALLKLAAPIATLGGVIAQNYDEYTGISFFLSAVVYLFVSGQKKHKGSK